MILETKINITNIRSMVNAAENLQDAGKHNKAKALLKELGEELSQIKVDNDKA